MKTIKFIIEPIGPEDWEAVRAIYLERIATGHTTDRDRSPALGTPEQQSPPGLPFGSQGW